MGVMCTIENPTNSLFWKVPYIAELIQDFGGYNVVFDSCCHGGARKKSTKFLVHRTWVYKFIGCLSRGKPACTQVLGADSCGRCSSISNG